jgi:anti-anti-sigma factor
MPQREKGSATRAIVVTSPHGEAWASLPDGLHLCADYEFESMTVLTIVGDIDAFNTDHLTRFVTATVKAGQALILDLSQVSFLAVAGLRALLQIGEACLLKGMPWTVITSEAVEMTLRATETEGEVPTTNSMDAALQWMTPEVVDVDV